MEHSNNNFEHDLPRARRGHALWFCNRKPFKKNLPECYVWGEQVSSLLATPLHRQFLLLQTYLKTAN